MFRQLSQSLSRSLPFSFRKRSLTSILIATPCLLAVGCRPIELPALIAQVRPLREVSLSWQVDKAAQPGAYQISGQTNLPDQTQLTVAALRYLYPAVSAAGKFKPEPTYAILDYQSINIERGSWKTQLNLWQVAPDRSFKESWQLDQQGISLRFNPQSDVVFLVTVAPIDQLPELQRQLARQKTKFADGMVRSTSTGEQYAQSRQTMTIALPAGSTLATPTYLEAENMGWGRRYLIPQEPQNPTQLKQPQERQTDAPVTVKEFMQ